MPPTDLSVARRVDAACDRFEAAWQAGQGPRIEDYLGPATGADRTVLLQALLAVEVELRRAGGEAVTAAAYRRRFPDDAAAVESALAGRPRAGETSVSRESVRTGEFAPRPETVTDPGVPERIGRFAVTGVLGAGAFGRVFRATDPQLGRDVAIKVPLPSAVESPADRERFLREARAAAGLHHPNICPVHEVGEADGLPFIVMGFIPGQTLAAVLKARKEPLAPRQAALIARKLALALDAAHRKGVVHRDLKPANVMFDKERRDVVVTDFGLARAPRLGDDQTTREGLIMGTPAYMSPEQARGDTRAVGPASDQFAVGVMLYEMLTGRRPFSGTVTEVLGKILHVEPEPPTAVRPGLDPGLAAVCTKAMGKDPAARYASMRQLADALLGYASDGPTAGPAAPATASAETAKGATETQRIAEVFAFTEQAVEKAIRKHRTPPWVKVGLGLLLVVGFAVLGGIVFFTRSEKVGVKLTVLLTDVDLKDKSLTYFLDDAPITAAALETEVELKPGEHVFTVKRGDGIVKRMLFTVTGGKEPGIQARDITPPPVRKEEKDGWTPLFNGTDLTGWKAVGGPKWSWADGRLLGSPAPDGTPGFLLTEAEYGDFELELQYRLGPAGGSGLFLRCVATGQNTGLGQMEFQLIDDGAYPKLPEANKTGSLYAVFARRAVPTARPGEWNAVRVRLVGRHIEAWVNGTRTLDADLDAAGDKLATLPGLTRKAGGIGLQLNQKSDVEFRNARIKNLAPPAAGGFVPLFGGTGLAGWDGLPGAWRWDGGLLLGTLPPGRTRNTFLASRAAYRDFELKFRVKLHTPTGNSGVQVRSRVEDPGEAIVAGPQVEIDGGQSLGGLYGERTGAWMKQAPGETVRRVFKPDAFNDYFVRVVGKRVKIVVNGETLVDDGFPTMADEGVIAFQLHGGAKSDVTFRDVLIRELR